MKKAILVLTFSLFVTAFGATPAFAEGGYYIQQKMQENIKEQTSSQEMCKSKAQSQEGCESKEKIKS